MGNLSHLFVAGTGALTPIGTGIDMVQASMDAGVNRYELVNIFDEENNDLQMSLIPTIALNQS
ncbi:MAG: hypothetical protein ACI9Y1_002024, partial [Lentisphaeria bacterium]